MQHISYSISVYVYTKYGKRLNNLLLSIWKWIYCVSVKESSVLELINWCNKSRKLQHILQGHITHLTSWSNKYTASLKTLINPLMHHRHRTRCDYYKLKPSQIPSEELIRATCPSVSKEMYLKTAVKNTIIHFVKIENK